MRALILLLLSRTVVKFPSSLLPVRIGLYSNLPSTVGSWKKYPLQATTGNYLNAPDLDSLRPRRADIPVSIH